MAAQFYPRVAIHDMYRDYTYKDLYDYSAHITTMMVLTRPGARLGILTPNSAQFMACVWAVWMCGGVVVPLCKSHPPPTIKYYLEDSGAELVLATTDMLPKVSGLGVPVLEVGPAPVDLETMTVSTAEVTPEDAAMILYTSGTTGPPKGVVLTHSNLESQTSCLLTAWGWSQDDRLLHVLPLHHTHGIINSLLCPLSVGAAIIMLDHFNARAVWDTLLSSPPIVNMLFAVPTMYAKLLEHHTLTHMDAEATVTSLSSNLRLMVSGSAALPSPVLRQWREVSGHTLLERYGMTEIGMALSNPLVGKRREGCVGSPLPGVHVRIVRWDDGGQYTVLAEGSEVSVIPGHSEEGELIVRGNNVFREYWQKPKETMKEFTEDGWFRTGDTAKVEDGVFRILGRTSVDIIKSGGYKISALDVERVMLTHPQIEDVAVMGIQDSTWGQRVAAVVVVREGNVLGLEEVREWCKDRIAPYSAPTHLKVVKEMPRNVMGKINKKELVKTVLSDD